MTTAVAAPGYCVDDGCACHIPGNEVVTRGGDGHPEDCCPRCGRRGPQPMTVVPPVEWMPLPDFVARIERTRREHGDVLAAFHRVWYECGHTWATTQFCGQMVMKAPTDLWTYQELIAALRPNTIIETGTYTGASARWFACLQDLLHIDDGEVFTIDIDDHLRGPHHPRVHYIRGDCLDVGLVAELAQQVMAPLLISLDSDHAAAHVHRELELYAPLTQIGDYVVVEDTNISWVGGPGADRGARGGVEEYLRVHPGEFLQDLTCEKQLLTCHPGGWLRRVGECDHGPVHRD